jgi:G protein beta subunit-like protein
MPVIFATAGYDHTIRFWQAQTRLCYRTIQHVDSQVNALSLTPDRHMIAAAGYQHVRMFDLASNNPNCILNYDGIAKNVTSVGFHSDGNWMYTGGEDNSARVWDLRSRNLQCSRIFQVNSSVNCTFLHPNQGELLVGDQAGAIHIWDLKTDHNEQIVPDPEASIQSIAIDSEGKTMAAVNNKGMCFIWTLTSMGGTSPMQPHLKTQFQAHKRYALKCLFSPDSTLLATSSADQSVKIWRTADFSLLSQLNDPTQRWVWDIAFSWDSQYLVSGSSDGNARLWNVDTGSIIQEYAGSNEIML